MNPVRGLGARLLGRLAEGIAARPKVVLIACSVLAALAATQVAQLEVTTSRTHVDSARTRGTILFGEFLEEFGTPNDLIAVIDGSEREERRRAADELAAELQRDPGHVRSTFHKVDLEFFLDHILLFAPTNEIGQIKQALSSSFADDIRAGRVKGLDAIVDELTSAFAGRSAAANIDPARATRGIEAMATIMGELGRRLDDPQRTGLEGLRDLLPPLSAGAIDDEGYLQSRDGKLRVVFIRPADRSDENNVVRPLLQSVRAIAASVAERHPGIRIRITGLPALQVDEAEIVDHDMKFTTALSLLFISIILVYGYRKPQQVLLTLVPLAIGILWTLALVRWKYGKINLVASAFMPILLGRGSDFAIYLMARFNAARGYGHPPRLAVRESLSAAGGGVVTGALVTSAAFLVTTFAGGQFSAFGQLGVVVGAGLVLVLIASLLVTPAILLLVGDYRLPGEQRAEQVLGAVPDFGQGPGRVALSHPKLVLLVTAVLVATLGAFARSVPLDYDLLKFLPPSAESVTAQRDLSAPPPHGSDFGTDVVVVTADSVEAARRKTAELEALPTVGRVESIASFLPADQPQKLAEIATMRGLVETIPPFAPPQPPTTPEALGKSLEKLSDAVDDAVFLARKQGNALADPLEKFGTAVTDALQTLHRLPPDEAQHRVENVEDQVFALLIRVRALLRVNVLEAQPVTIGDLPRATRERFIGKTGKFAIYVFPKPVLPPVAGRAHPPAGLELAPFVEEVRSVAPNATGFPIIYYDSSHDVWRTFKNAALASLVVIVLALLLHFRSLSATGLALIPLLIASVAMFGLMQILHVPLNIANIVALPLLIGLGTDYGLQLIHHRRTVPDEPLPDVLRKTGLGVFMAGGSTAAGFGALALARHAGARTLGLVLFLGTSAALLCSLVVLPAILCLIDRRHDRRGGRFPAKPAKPPEDPYLLIPDPPPSVEK